MIANLITDNDELQLVQNKVLVDIQLTQKIIQVFVNAIERIEDFGPNTMIMKNILFALHKLFSQQTSEQRAKGDCKIFFETMEGERHL